MKAVVQFILFRYELCRNLPSQLAVSAPLTCLD